MSIELIAILIGYLLTGFVWLDLGRKIDRKANHATMMPQFQYLVQEIRRVEAGQPIAD